MANHPKVSVCVVTYNQEAYIEQCLETLALQQTDFDFEILVSDDCSKDKTREIIEKMAAKYPVIKPFYHEKNLGAWNNFYFVHKQAKGELIAHMDGDDYVLPGKLQAQKDFFDSHPDCNVLWHRVKFQVGDNPELFPDNLDIRQLPSEGISRALLASLITVGANSTKMYRAETFNFEIPDFAIVDYFANIEQIGNGKGYIVNDQFYGVYRLGIGFATSTNISNILLCKSFVYFKKKYPSLTKYLNSACLLLLLADLKNRRWANAWLYFVTFVRTFHPGSVLILIKRWSLYKMLRFK